MPALVEKRFVPDVLQLVSKERPSPRVFHTMSATSVFHSADQFCVELLLVGGEAFDIPVEDSAYSLRLELHHPAQDESLPPVPQKFSPEYRLSSESLSISNGPAARLGSAIAIRSGNLFLFGGEAPGNFFSHSIYSDLYYISLVDLAKARPAWKEVKTTRNAPIASTGHTMTSVDAIGGIVVFGGMRSEGWSPARPVNFVHILLTGPPTLKIAFR